MEGDVERRGLPLLREELNRRGLIHDGHGPVLQRDRIVGDGAQGLCGQLLAAQRHGLAQRLTLRQRRVQIGHELGGGDDVDVIAHRYHAAHARVHHFLGEGAEGADLRMGVGPHTGIHPHPCLSLLRERSRVGMRRAAGIEDQHGRLRLDEQCAQLQSADQFEVVGQRGILEGDIAVFAGAVIAEEQAVERYAVGLQFGVQAVPVKVDNVIGLARSLRGAQDLAHNCSNVGGRSTSSWKRARASSLKPLMMRLATERKGTSARPPGRQMTSRMRITPIPGPSPVATGEGRKGRCAGFGWARTKD